MKQGKRNWHNTEKCILFPGPTNITSKPTDPPATSPFRITVASTTAPTGPSTTVAPTTAEAETTTATAAAAAEPSLTLSPAADDDPPRGDPNSTGRLSPIPPTPTDAPQQPPDVETPHPPIMEGEDNATIVAPGTPTPETYIEDDDDTDVVEPETTIYPDMGFSTEPSPHGEYFFVNSREFYMISSRQLLI